MLEKAAGVEGSSSRRFTAAGTPFPPTVTHLEAEQFTAAVGIDFHGDHSSSGADLLAATKSAVERPLTAPC